MKIFVIENLIFLLIEYKFVRFKKGSMTVSRQFQDSFIFKNIKKAILLARTTFTEGGKVKTQKTKN